MEQRVRRAMSKYVVLVDRSAGNESVGEMWQETRIFDETDTLKDVMDWALMLNLYQHQDVPAFSSRRITITKPHQEAIKDDS